jgi:hypothetical protein
MTDKVVLRYPGEALLVDDEVRELDQRQRITSCLAEDARREDRMQLRCPLVEQCGGSPNAQPAQAKLPRGFAGYRVATE